MVGVKSYVANRGEEQSIHVLPKNGASLSPAKNMRSFQNRFNLVRALFWESYLVSSIPISVGLRSSKKPIAPYDRSFAPIYYALRPFQNDWKSLLIYFRLGRYSSFSTVSQCGVCL